MVCETCMYHHFEKIDFTREKNLPKVICPDPWKAGARNTHESGGRKVNENKLLSKNRMSPYGKYCKVCKSMITMGMYCQGCAYKKDYACENKCKILNLLAGLCSNCGKMILDTKMYKQSSK